MKYRRALFLGAQLLFFGVVLVSTPLGEELDPLIDPPEQMTADLRHWPFGALERVYAKGSRGRPGVAFLQRAVRDGFPNVPKWRERLRAVRDKPLLHRLILVNALVNSIPYVADKNDEWKHPRIFLTEGGDCDCATVSKYVLLRGLGLAATDLRVVGLRIRGDPGSHVVLVVRTGAGRFQVLLLDNRSDAVRTALYADEYTPLVSMNEHGIWVHGDSSSGFIEKFVNPELEE